MKQESKIIVDRKDCDAAIMLRQMVEQLKAAGVKSAALDARLLLQAIAGVSQTELLAGRAPPLTAAMQAKLAQAIKRREQRESVHRILGRRAFYGLDLALSPATLEPRPDSEALVDLLLPLIRQKAAENQRRPVKLLDMGTGSGALALALMQQVAQLQAVGVDIAAEALATAQKNAAAAGLAERFTALESDWFAAVAGRFDFIVSNPPYIPRADIERLADEVRLYEPRRALDGGQDGLDFYRALAVGAPAHLAPGGRLAVEAGFGQVAAIIALFQAAGFRHRAIKRDLAGIDRALLFVAA